MNGSFRYGRGLILVACACLPYLFGAFHGFVFDDHGTIVENSFLQNPAHSIQAATLQTIGDASVVDGNRPVVLLSYFLDRAVWGLRPFGYHLTNLLLHAAVTLLVFSLARRIGDVPGDWAPFAAAALFALHPALTEAVQLPSYREDLLCVLFILLCLRCSLIVSKGASALAVLFMIPAILSKESAVAIPLLLAWLHGRLPVPVISRRRAWSLVMATGVIAAVFLAWWRHGPVLQAVNSSWNGLSLQFPSNLLTAPWIFLQYLRLLIAPWALAADYVAAPITGILDLRFFAGLLAMTFVAVVAFSAGKTPLAVGCGWMLLAFLPVSNLLPLFNPMAERYLYLIAVGFVLAAGWGLSRIRSQQVATLALALICALFAGRVIARLEDWKDDPTIWSATLDAQPRSARAHTWLGLHQKQLGHREAARTLFQQAEQLNPHDVSGLLNLAVLEGEAGRFEEADRLLREAIRRQPKNIQAHWNLSVARYNLGDEAGMISSLEETLQLDPFYLPAHRARLDWLLATGQNEKAIPAARLLLEIDPTDKTALHALPPP
ncbi:MAG: hypothetical protein A2X46_13890 [Lentisphaerae bacterium GWF2_57_35]|nr:MAG: hypothetical protein A2X46_13890 [Lentisphaerae bacterium GWF2_57_35]